MADTTDTLRMVGALAPIVRDLMTTAEKSSAPGADKRREVLELTASIYEGARRTGALDGVKELRGVDWSLIAPLVGLLIDGLARLFNALGIWISSRSKPTVVMAKVTG